MLRNTRRRPKRSILSVTVAIVLLMAGVGAYGLIKGPDHHKSMQTTKTVSRPPNATPTATAPGTTNPPSTPAAPPRPPAVAESTDPQRFARAAASALFDWDTTIGYQPADIAQVVVAVGDPTGIETGLASDVRTYVPTNYDWTDLRTYHTKQWLTIKRAYVPDQWATALAQAKPGQLRPGTVAYTIIGTRHRSGTWLTQPVSTEHSVAFTMIITCKPTFQTCRLLRIGKLNSPLN